MQAYLIQLKLKNSFLRKHLTYFHQWTRKGWAVFFSLNKVIKIAVLALTLTLVAEPKTVVAQSIQILPNDSVEELEEVEIKGLSVPVIQAEILRPVTMLRPLQLQASPISSINDALLALPQVDIRQRGPLGVQADIAMRGSSFDQVMILLNGLPMNNLQTGHHNMDLPISMDDVARIEVLSGPASNSYGPDAYAGAINFITKKPLEKSLHIDASYGAFGYHKLNTSTSFGKGKTKHFLSLGTEGSGAYTNNTDFQNSRLFYSNFTSFKKSRLSFQSAVSSKNFGAQSFYTPKYPNQFESTQKWISSLNFHSYRKTNTRISAYFQAHSDKFELFRIEETAPSWYKNHNYHLSYSSGINSRFIRSYGFYRTVLGANYRYTKLHSSVLGESTGDSLQALFFKEGFYTHSAQRNNLALFAQQLMNRKKLQLSISVMANYWAEKDDKVYFFPGIDASYRFSRWLNVHASYSTAMRQPSFTDLYYSGPANMGNPDLHAEQTQSLEFGYSWVRESFKLQMLVFYNEGKNTIDWGRSADTLKWQAKNIGQTKTLGSEASFCWYPLHKSFSSWIEYIQVSGSIQNRDKSANDYQSQYLDDFVKQKLSIQGLHKFAKNTLLSWDLIWLNRNGSFSRYDITNQSETEETYGSHTILNIKLEHYRGNHSIFISVRNLLNTSYWEYGNVPSPGRWISAGLRLKLI